MELDWTTFVLEVINFLVLVWILRRYLYRPVLNTLAARKAGQRRGMRVALPIYGVQGFRDSAPPRNPNGPLLQAPLANDGSGD